MGKKNLAGIRRALVTGAGRGIGAAVATLLCSRGVEVWLVDKDPGGLEEIAEKIRSAGGSCHSLVVDVADTDAARDRFEQLDDESGGIDLVLANAAVTGARAGMDVITCPWPVAQQILTVNLVGVAATLWPFVPRMVRRGGGRLAAMSSISGSYPNPRTPAYGASKAGVAYLLRSMDIALRPHGVSVTSIHPGFVQTPGTAEISDPVPFLVGEHAAAVRIVSALRRRRRRISFPRRLFALFFLIRLLPPALYDRATRALTYPRAASRDRR